MTHWRVMLNTKLWDQPTYEEKWQTQPEVRRLAQSKGRCKMVVVPRLGDDIAFVYRGKIVMRGIMESDGFVSGDAHKQHSCNLGEQRPHTDVTEFAWVRITTVGLSEDIRKTGQRTWARY